MVSDNLMGLRELRGVEIWAPRARVAAASQPADPGHDARPADGPGRRAVLAVPAGRPRPGRPFGQGNRAADRRPGDATRPHDRRAAERPDDPPDPQRRRPRARDIPTNGSKRESRASAGSRSGPATRATGWRSGSRTTGEGSTARRSSRKGIALGMVPTGTPADDPRVVSLIFEPGFSTRDTVSELSGRGVGLDVVRDAVRGTARQRGGREHPGQGDGLHLPLAADAGPDRRTSGRDGRRQVRRAAGAGRGMRGARTALASALAEGRPCVAVRGELVPMVSLRNLFRADGPLPAAARIVTDAPRRPAGRRGRRPACWAASRRSSSRWARACTASTGFPEPRSWATAPSP